MVEVFYSKELWKASLKTIEGNFGMGVMSYFLFLKWLFLFNIPTFLIVFFFLVIPQLIWRAQNKNSSFYMASNASFTGVELLSGGDWFKRTELYFGSYTNLTINVIGDTSYNMRFAYLLTCAGFYVITLLVLAYSLVKSYKIHFIEGSQSNQLYYVAKVLCGWDFTVTEEATCISHHTALSKELQEYVKTFGKAEEHKTWPQWCGMVFLRLVINIAVVAALAGFGYLVWFVAPLTDATNTGGNFLKDITTPLVISAINLIVPFMFSYLASVENYHNPWVDIFLTMLRTITLNIVTLGALLMYWFISSDISCTKRTTSTTMENITLSMANVTESPADESCTKVRPVTHTQSLCWENFVGQQFYCLVVIDFIFIILGTLCSEFLYKVRITGDENKAPEFNIGRNTLNLIYSQALVWLGVYYCPFLPLIMIVKLLILFYIKKVSVMYNCRPSEKSWRGGPTYTIILLLLFVTFLLCFIALSYSIAFMSSSQDCGPFYGYNTSYAVVTEAVDSWQKTHKSGFASALVEILTSAAFYITIFMIFCAIAYYTRLVSKGRKEVVARLRKQIQMEGKDKNFLKKVADHVRNKGANAGGPRQRVTQTPSGAGRPQRGVRGHRENNNNPTGRYEPTDRAPQAHPYSQVTPAEVMNPGYRDQSPTRKPDLPYFTGQQYPANM
ncbi:hypothetical protein NP493_1324g01045 [Ridgeia piscesae]|uniref:TMC domain-containing protein n=1 Tax=Ridgeia piscesae TaxID=27915 RepID=A0AAD9K7K8_RIDPI|nr:hypothetical protein NP493_1324g01045 [Ridgeia piscesae]